MKIKNMYTTTWKYKSISILSLYFSTLCNNTKKYKITFNYTGCMVIDMILVRVNSSRPCAILCN